MRFMPHTEADVAAMLDGDRRHAYRRPDRARAGELARQRRHQARARPQRSRSCTPNFPRWRRSIADAHSFVSFLGAGYYRHFMCPPPCARLRARRIRDQLHAVPSRGEPGHHAGDLRISNADHAAHGDWKSPTPACTTARRPRPRRSLMARRMLPKRRSSRLSRALWPDYRATIRTYLSALKGLEVVEVPFDDATGVTDLAALDQRRERSPALHASPAIPMCSA